MEVTVHTPLFREVFWHEYEVTVNGVNSNVWSRKTVRQNKNIFFRGVMTKE